MKSLINGLMCVALMTFAVACGKDSKKSSGLPNTVAGIGAYTGVANLPPESQAFLNEINAWANALEVPRLSPFLKTIIPLQSQGTQNPSTCQGEVKKVLGLEFCFYTSFNSSGSNSSNITETLYNVVPNVNNDYQSPIYCDIDRTIGTRPCKTTGVYGGKPANPRLVEALSGRGNTLHLSKITKQGTVYTMIYTRSAVETFYPSVVFQIDTSKHSIHNPIQVIDYSAASPVQEVVQVLQQLI